MFYIESSFYCMKCGQKGLPIQRRKSLQREKMHRKKLYCIYCKEEINHIECKTQEDVNEFIINFKNGAYINEAEESLAHVRSTSLNII